MEDKVVTEDNKIKVEDEQIAENLKKEKKPKVNYLVEENNKETENEANENEQRDENEAEEEETKVDLGPDTEKNISDVTGVRHFEHHFKKLPRETVNKRIRLKQRKLTSPFNVDDPSEEEEINSAKFELTDSVEEVKEKWSEGGNVQEEDKNDQNVDGLEKTEKMPDETPVDNDLTEDISNEKSSEKNEAKNNKKNKQEGSEDSATQEESTEKPKLENVEEELETTEKEMEPNDIEIETDAKTVKNTQHDSTKKKNDQKSKKQKSKKHNKPEAIVQNAAETTPDLKKVTNTPKDHNPKKVDRNLTKAESNPSFNQVDQSSKRRQTAVDAYNDWMAKKKLLRRKEANISKKQEELEEQKCLIQKAMLNSTLVVADYIKKKGFEANKMKTWETNCYQDHQEWLRTCLKRRFKVDSFIWPSEESLSKNIVEDP